jgi:peptidoglycan/LPS O-acetylase OafA/YrhL
MMLGLDPMWSLAVEEQFYLIIPFILLMFPRRSIPWVIALIAVVSLAFRTFDSAIPDGLLYANPRLTHERIHFLALGVLVALGSRAHVWGVFACWVGLLLLSGARNGQLEIPAALGVIVYLGFVLKGRAFLIEQHIGEIGRLCYGIYLLHYPIQVGMKLIGRSPGWLAGMGLFGVYVVCTLAAAKFSFKYFEYPLQQFGRKYLRG